MSFGTTTRMGREGTGNLAANARCDARSASDEVAMEERKIEAWTGPVNAEGSTMIGALVQAADGSIKQIDDSLRRSRWRDMTCSAASQDLAAGPPSDELRDNGYPNAHLEFPWQNGDA